MPTGYLGQLGNNVKCRLRAGIVKQEKVITARLQHGKHAFVEINEHATIKDVAFSMWSLPQQFSQEHCSYGT
jgi:predicted DNA-binding protein with PD1-like motif